MVGGHVTKNKICGVVGALTKKYVLMTKKIGKKYALMTKQI